MLRCLQDANSQVKQAGTAEGILGHLLRSGCTASGGFFAAVSPMQHIEEDLRQHI